jgi:hypothetical protein
MANGKCCRKKVSGLLNNVVPLQAAGAGDIIVRPPSQQKIFLCGQIPSD